MTLEDLITTYGTYPYPRFVFNRDKSALFLFCAGFYGGHDLLHAYTAGLTNVVGIDQNKQKIDRMRKLYPDSYRFFVADVYKSEVDISLESNKFDLVCAEVQNDQVDKAQEYLPLWCSWANNHVVVNIRDDTVLNIPNDWKELGKIFRTDDRKSKWLILAKR